MEAVAHGELGGGRVYPDEGRGRERSADRWREALVALHLMHLFHVMFS